jgi:uncharacterized membrane protein YbhN (UPF0104 family)
MPFFTSRGLMRKRRLTGLLKIAVSLGLLAAVLAFTGWREVLGRLASVQAGWLALALGVYLAGVWVRALRWQVLLGGLGVRPRNGTGTGGLGILRLVQLYFVSFFFNSFLPTGIGGDVVRIAEAARCPCAPRPGEGGPGQTVGAARAASSVVADRAVGLVSTSLLALLALPFAGGGVPWPVIAIAAVIAFGVPAGFALVAGREAAGLTWLGRRVPGLRRLTDHRKVRETAAAFTAYRPRDLAIALGVSAVFSASNAINYASIAEAVGIHLPIAYYMLVSPIVTLVLLLPISFNGLGTRDGAYLALFVPAGVTPDGALAMSLMYHVLNYVTAILGGMVYAGMGTAESLADSGEK